jgi:hypothetical protein
MLLKTYANLFLKADPKAISLAIDTKFDKTALSILRYCQEK